MCYPDNFNAAASGLYPAPLDYAAQAAAADIRRREADLKADALTLARKLAEASKLMREALAAYRRAQPDVDCSDMPVPHGAASDVDEMTSGTEADFCAIDATYIARLEAWVDWQGVGQ